MKISPQSRPDNGLPESAIHKICAVFARNPQVEKAILYGSRAKGTYRNGSDIDLTLCGGADLTLSVRHSIANELDDLLLPYMIDLSILRDISDHDVIEHIQRIGTPLYERQQQLMDEGIQDNQADMQKGGKL